MKDHEIIADAEGFQVCQVERIILGTFARKEDAAFFRDALAAREHKPEPMVRCLSNPSLEGASPVSGSPTGSVAPRRQAKAPGRTSIRSDPDPQGNLEPAGPSPTAERPAAKTHPALFAAAEARLIDGDDLKTVAAEAGIPMTRLRGWWAARRKGGEGSAPANVARRAPAGLSDEAEDALLTICRSDDPEEGIRAFAAAHGLSPAECRRTADKLLDRGA